MLLDVRNCRPNLESQAVGSSSMSKFWTRNSPSQVSDRLTELGYELVGEYKSNKLPVQARCQLCGSIEEIRLNALRNRKSRGCLKCRGAKSTKKLSFEEAKHRVQQIGFELCSGYQNKRSVVEIECSTCRTRKFVSFASILSQDVACLNCRLARRLQMTPSHSFNELVDRGFRSHGFEPLEDFESLSTKRLCRCLSCGTEQPKSLTHLIAGTQGCSMCSGQALKLDDIASRFHSRELQPLEPYSGDNKKPRRCRCMRCGKEIRVSLNGLRRGRGCKFCAKRGIVRGQPGYLYLIDNPELRAIKVGIGAANSEKNRLDTHLRRGWQIVAVWDFDLVEDAEVVESEVLRRWRGEGVPDALTKSEMPYGGWTETAPYLHRTAEEAWEEVALIVHAFRPK